MQNRPPIHVLNYGDTGTGKSSFFATFPLPMLVWCFDPHGKDIPYWKRRGVDGVEQKGQVSEVGQYTIGTYQIPYRDVIYADGAIRIEYYHDPEPEQPFSYAMFLARMALFQNEYAQWKTVVLDSVTFMELAARKRHEKVLNQMVKYAKGTDTRQWFAGSTDDLEEMLVMRFGGLPMNVGLSCHIDERKNESSGEIIRSAFAPGRLSKRGLLNAAYQEQYHQYCVRGEAGERLYQLQTVNHSAWAATTQINAPDPSFPHYESLWVNWRG